MSGGHAHAVDPSRPFDGPIERLAPEAKLAAVGAFLVAVVTTPVDAVWAFAVDAVVIGTIAVAALVAPRVLARRLLFELPVLGLAVALVLAGRSPTVPVLGLHLSQPGLWTAWGLLARATLGVLAVSVLAATTTPGQVIEGLERLHVPVAFTAVAAFAVRYLAVLRGELERMRLAQSLRRPGARGGQVRDLATVAASLFVRSYERGERVHVAMSARGARLGHAPAVDCPSGAGAPVGALAGGRSGARDWAWAAMPATVALAAAVAARVWA